MTFSFFSIAESVSRYIAIHTISHPSKRIEREGTCSEAPLKRGAS
jgi:hypothetical protein